MVWLLTSSLPRAGQGAPALPGARCCLQPICPPGINSLRLAQRGRNVMPSPWKLARAQCVLEVLPVCWQVWERLCRNPAASRALLRDLPGSRRCSHRGDDLWLESLSWLLHFPGSTSTRKDELVRTQPRKVNSCPLGRSAGAPTQPLQVHRHQAPYPVFCCTRARPPGLPAAGQRCRAEGCWGAGGIQTAPFTGAQPEGGSSELTLGWAG